MKIQTTEIEQLYKEILEKKKQIIKLQQEQELEEIQDYVFQNKEGENVLLSSLFDERNELLVIHNMGKSCAYCTMWADGFRGYSDMISDRMPWVLTSPDSFSEMKLFSDSRKWNFNFLSFYNTDFAKDLGFQKEREGKKIYWPGVSALIRKEGKIFRSAKDSFGPGDFYNPVWHFLDLFPKGANGWQPKFNY